MFAMLRVTVWLFVLAGLTIASIAQTSGKAGDPPFQISNGNEAAELHVPREVLKAYESGTRSWDGKPGPNYWQNHATHKMKISLSPPDKTVHAEQEITYVNNSPQAMPILVFRLYMNAHQPEALRDKNIGTQFLNDGITVEEFRVNGKTVPWDDPASSFAANNQRGSTVHVIALPEPLSPKGSVKINMRWLTCTP